MPEINWPTYTFDRSELRQEIHVLSNPPILHLAEMLRELRKWPSENKKPKLGEQLLFKFVEE